MNQNTMFLRESFVIVVVQFLLLLSICADESAGIDTAKEVDRLRKAEALFNIGEYGKAEVLFNAELSVPETISPSRCKVGVTPKTVRIRIWLARCHGRLGRKAVALKECLQLVREGKGEWGWWNGQDRRRLAKTIIENAQTNKQMTEIEQFAQKQDFKELQEYFGAMALVKKGNTAEVVKYLTRSDLPVAVVEPALWRDEIAQKATTMKPAIIGYVKEQLEKAARWEDTDLSIYHLHHLFEVWPDESFVELCLGSPQLKRRFPDAHRAWQNIFQSYRKECRKTALLHIKGNRESKTHALDLINALQLYGRETLDAISVIAMQDYYPTQVRSLLALWRVSGQQFGLEANTTVQAIQQASDSDRRLALVKAVKWWKQQSEVLNAGSQVSVQTTNKIVLEKGMLCRVEMIRLDAISQLSERKQPTVRKKNIEQDKE